MPNQVQQILSRVAPVHGFSFIGVVEPQADGSLIARMTKESTMLSWILTARRVDKGRQNRWSVRLVCDRLGISAETVTPTTLENAISSAFAQI